MNGEAGEMILEECCKDEGWMGQARENAIATSVIKESAKGGVRHEPSSQKKKKKKKTHQRGRDIRRRSTFVK